MITLPAAGTAAPRSAAAPRRRIGARQGLQNALTLAWRNDHHIAEKLMDVTLMPIGPVAVPVRSAPPWTARMPTGGSCCQGWWPRWPCSLPAWSARA